MAYLSEYSQSYIKLADFFQFDLSIELDTARGDPRGPPLALPAESNCVELPLAAGAHCMGLYPIFLTRRVKRHGLIRVSRIERQGDELIAELCRNV
jgi:hypothetical protein